MNLIVKRRISRRDWIWQSAAATLAAGLWPGCATHQDNGRGGEFTFIALNDTHFSTPECPAFFEKLTASIKSLPVKPEFCLAIGDLAQDGKQSDLGPIRDVLRGLGMPFHASIGNHDYLSATDRSAWDQLFPKSLNYHFAHRDWQVIGLDSSEGVKYHNTRIQPETLRWVDEQLPRLGRERPTILFTHFPLGPGVRYRPNNADDLLERFKEFNIVAVFNGHFHAATTHQVGDTVFTTNKCCAVSRGNHDGTKEKGYLLCRTREGRIEREFVEVKMI
ncbi:MAG: metallophosphoesterase family protein [Limisphaerales bacterium]